MQANTIQIKKIKKYIPSSIKEKLKSIFKVGYSQKLGIKTYKEYSLERIGGSCTSSFANNDYGGWIIPTNLVDAESICYCVGAGENITFDCELIKKIGCNVLTFDPTPRAIKHIEELKKKVNQGQKMALNNYEELFYEISKNELAKLHFYPYGIWSKAEIKKFYSPKNQDHVSHSILNLQKTDEFFEAQCLTLKDAMKKFGHNRIDLLKLDIEGAEYEVIESLINDKIEVKIICVEFDEGNNPIDKNYFSRIKRSVDSLKNYGMLPIFMDSWNITFVQHKNKP